MFATQTVWFYIREVYLMEDGNIEDKRLKVFTKEKTAKEVLEIYRDLKKESRFYIEEEIDIDYC
ncbi:hypothetical protein CN367_11805 [Priestia megaterium]|uniref:hypothetical protein n=1 Tax=Priestia megaterium TaxID=1404 RepID=UPI000BF597C8|nr:hypothetical protein [Priestia megaterium]PEZ47044.1 hypothetical protein CN367_11805 [Priestia megaterium]